MADLKAVEINLSEPFPHLSHAPIVEAVIEIRARAQSSWAEQSITQQIKALLPDYPTVASQKQIQQEITIGLSQPKYAVHDLGWQGLHFQSADAKHVAQFGRDLFFLGRLHPYENWDHLLKEAMRLWQIHADVAKPLEIQRVGLRFINRIEMQPGDDLCETYIALPPLPVSGLELPVTGFFHQDTMAVPGYPLAANLIRTLQPPTKPEARIAIILDIDAFTTSAFPLNQEELVQRLQQMRWLKNKIFFGTVTEAAVNRFK